jgi:hypothetical protein
MMKERKTFFNNFLAFLKRKVNKVKQNGVAHKIAKGNQGCHHFFQEGFWGRIFHLDNRLNPAL